MLKSNNPSPKVPCISCLSQDLTFWLCWWIWVLVRLLSWIWFEVRCWRHVLSLLFGSACSLQIQSLHSTTHLVRVLKVRRFSSSNIWQRGSASGAPCPSLPHAHMERLRQEVEKHIWGKELRRKDRCFVMSFSCSRCRKCGTGGYLLTSTSSRKFNSCTTDSSVPTHQHGPGSLSPLTSYRPHPLCYLSCVYRPLFCFSYF